MTRSPGPGVALVTGATGFIGGHLAAALTTQGSEVHALVRSDAQADLPAGVRALPRPATASALAQELRSVAPDVVFHLATVFRGRHTADDIEPLVDANVLLGTQLAEALSANPPKVMVNVGTAWQRDERGSYRAAALYAATKQAMEDIFRYYAEAGAFPVADVKLYDTYGPADPRGKLLSILDEASRTGRALAMSPGDQLVDLLHVSDVVAALTRASELREAQWQSWSASSGDPLRVRDVVELFGRVTGRQVPVDWGAVDYRAREMFATWDAGASVPGWSPRVDLAIGIADIWGDPKQ